MGVRSDAFVFVNALDWSRPILIVLPLIGFVAGMATGLTGMGGAIVATALWQITWAVFRIPETDSIDLLVLVITLQQVSIVVSFGVLFWKTWIRFASAGVPYATVVMLCSPIGSFCREHLPSRLVQSGLAWTFIMFTSIKLKLPRLGKKKSVLKLRESASPEVCGKSSEPSVSALQKGSSNSAEELCAKVANGHEQLRSDTPGDQETPASIDVHERDFNLQQIKWSLLFSGIGTGIFGGLAGLTGPPFILLVTLCSVPKDIARPLFPLGMSLELPLRLGLYLKSHGISWLHHDAHLLLIYLSFNQLGLRLGNRLAKHISQTFFEGVLLVLLLLSSLVVLGILNATRPSVFALFIFVACLASRMIWNSSRYRGYWAKPREEKYVEVAGPCEHRSAKKLSSRGGMAEVEPLKDAELDKLAAR